MTSPSPQPEFSPRCLFCGRGLTNCVVNMSPNTLHVLGDCSKCGRGVVASSNSWSPEDFHLDLQGNVLGQLEFNLER